jgi:hypothetical protein
MAVTAGVVSSWVAWFRSPSRDDGPQWRNLAGFFSLLLVSLQAFLYYFYFFTQFHNFMAFLTWPPWSVMNRRIFLLLVLALILGKGRFRLFVLLTSLAIEVLWFLTGIIIYWNG